jgi:hypothetical protein
MECSCCYFFFIGLLFSLVDNNTSIEEINGGRLDESTIYVNS